MTDPGLGPPGGKRMVKVLFPVDGSEATYKAVDRALTILRPGKESSVTLLLVLSKGLREMPPEAREYLEFDDEDELFIRDDEAKAALRKAEEIAKARKVPNVRSVAREGKVKQVILDECGKHDLLVMHGLRRSEREDRRHGNMVEEIARQSGIDVLLIRDS